MKSFLILALIISFQTTGQKSDSLTLSGFVQIVSYHQGGAAMPDEYRLPNPYSTTFWIVEHIDSLTPPKVIKKVVTDANGVFSVELPIAEYGFVIEQDLKNLQPGQLFPASYAEHSAFEGRNTYWFVSEQLPFRLNSDKSITLTYYDITSCYACP